MHAKYKDSGKKYEALITSINGNTITVNWSDNDPNYRHVDAEDVFKDGAPCQPITGGDKCVNGNTIVNNM